VKLIIQIPCLNEAETLPDVLAGLPRHIDGIDVIEILVIDDGSDDDTAAVARALGVDHVVRHSRNLGLARAFEVGIDRALRQGADIIVNTDADNQYPGRYIVDLVTPILAGEADMVIGDRQIGSIDHFSWSKKMLQRLGSWMVRNVSGTNVPDTVSGFRAYSRDTALRLNVLTQFSYTVDTLIQAGKKGLTIVSVPIETNDPTRPSRLQRGKWHFVRRQAATIVRLYAFYEPLRTFLYISLPFLLVGLFLLLRFGYFFATENGVGHVQSVTIGSGLFIVGIFIALFGVQADISSKHRLLTDETLYRLKKLELERLPVPDDSQRQESSL
jgi:glycosyltransferase involved in cell wall biosynthesis